MYLIKSKFSDFGEISENIDFDDGFNFVTWAQTHEFWNDSV